MPSAGRQMSIPCVWSEMASLREQQPGHTWPRRGSQQTTVAEPSRQKDQQVQKSCLRPDNLGCGNLHGKEKGNPPQEENSRTFCCQRYKKKGKTETYCINTDICHFKDRKSSIQLTCRKKTYIQLKFTKYLLSFYHGQIITLW